MRFDISDPQQRAVVETARSWGVSPSVFMGRVLYSVQHEDAGARWFQHDPAWTDEDRQAAFDLAAYEADLCPGCSQPLAETTAPENEERYRAYLAARCHRCTAVEQFSESQQDKPSPSALLIGVQFRAEALPEPGGQSPAEEPDEPTRHDQGQ